MRDAQMNAWKSWANKRNTYDDAYVMGYYNGYHKQGNMNEYDKDEQHQYYIKYKHGYTAGKLMRVKEERKQV